MIDELEGLTKHLDVKLVRDEPITIKKALRLKPGVSDEKFTRLEEILNVNSSSLIRDERITLHNYFKTLYRIFNGQKLNASPEEPEPTVK